MEGRGGTTLRVCWQEQGIPKEAQVEEHTVRPSRITRENSQEEEFAGVTREKFIIPINSLRIFWSNRWCNRS